MKKIICISLLVFGLSACMGNAKKNAMEVGQFTTIEIQKVYDAGAVAKGEMIKKDIVVKNTGDYPLVIAEVEPACSCTVSKFDQNPIPPGKTTIIKATIDTDKTGVGKISKPINITANTRPSTTTVVIKANVIQ